jgi:GAF domain-containing protein
MQDRSREERIVDVLVGLVTRASGPAFDPAEFLHGLTADCIDLLDCAEAGVLLRLGTGTLHAAASSNEDSGALDLLQSQDREGPCFDCCRLGRSVFSDDLDRERGRWPVFSHRALDAGFAAVQAVPMREDGRVVGAVNLFRTEPGRLAVRDLSLAQGMADLAAAGLAHERTVRDIRDRADRLEHALTSRVAIEQAKGILAERLEMAPDDAFRLLRNYARARNLRLGSVAEDLIRGRISIRPAPAGADVEKKPP